MFLSNGLKKASMFVSCTALIQSVIAFVLQANMQVKRSFGKAILHKLSIVYEYMWLFWVSTLFGMTWVFFKCSESSTTFFVGFDLYKQPFISVVNVPRSYVSVLLAMQEDIDGCWNLWFLHCDVYMFWKFLKGS